MEKRQGRQPENRQPGNKTAWGTQQVGYLLLLELVSEISIHRETPSGTKELGGIISFPTPQHTQSSAGPMQQELLNCLHQAQPIPLSALVEPTFPVKFASVPAWPDPLP